MKDTLSQWQFLLVNTRPLFNLFSFFSSHFYTLKIAEFSGIPTGIVRVEDEHADHLNTTKGRYKSWAVA